jgi:hypothetical protein
MRALGWGLAGIANSAYSKQVALEAVCRLLATSGYEVRFRDGEWIECLISREGEAWLGAGRDRGAALDDAVRKACPSALARNLLEQAAAALGGGGATSDLPRVREVPEIHDTREVQALPPDMLSAQHDATTVDLGRDVLPAHSVSVIGEVRTNGKSSVPGISPVTRPPPLLARSGLARPQPTPPPLVRRDSVLQSRMDPPRALDELEILAERIRDSREELGLCSPDRQRLAMLAWICEARAHTDAFPEDPRIRDRVGAISRQLTEIGKTFWPGSVTALQLQMQPRDLPRHVLGGPASTWSRAAELAERALRSLEYADERRGFDAYGWADALNTFPPPLRPGDVLEEVVREMESAGGSIAHNAVPRDGDIRPDPDRFVTWVRKARWLRTTDVDPDRWARAAGRLRWWSCQRDAALAQAARELEASHAPLESWARILGIPEAQLDNGAATRAPSPAMYLPDHLLEDVRSAISGKRMVFVSTRRDPDLQTQLQDALPAAALDWRVAEPKRLEALGEAIQQGAYDVVLGAIGFQSQGTDNLLARVCRVAGVKYLRVNRGRPSACLRALARDLEIIS